MTVYERIAQIGHKFKGKAWTFKTVFNLSPMYRRSTGRLVEVSDDLSDIRVRIKLNWKNANYRGSMFGGSMFSATDPIPMVALIQILGDDFVVWDKSASIRFLKPAREDLYARMAYSLEDLELIRTRVAADGEFVFDMAVPLTNRSESVTYALVDKQIYVADKAFFKEKQTQKRNAQSKKP